MRLTRAHPRSPRPAHALYFATYEAAKKLFGGNEHGHHPVAAASAGAAATLVNDAAMTPVDVIKQRLQVGAGCVGGAWVGWIGFAKQLGAGGWESGSAQLKVDRTRKGW